LLKEKMHKEIAKDNRTERKIVLYEIRKSCAALRC
jgi:hypothetical protein